MAGVIPRGRDHDVGALAEAKRRRAHRVSVCIPARNEEATVGSIVRSVHADLVVAAPLVDEVLVLDDASTDATATVAREAGAQVVPVRSVLAETGVGHGKGNVLWRSLYAATGDILCWVDADLRSFEASYVTGLVAPLVSSPEPVFVKASYERSFHGTPREGGRVTELLARPLIERLFPHLASIRQPLGGEYAARRHAIESIPVVEGWGLELALLIDISERYGVDAIEQVDLGVRTHRNRPLAELAPQASAILATGLRRAGLSPASAGENLIRERPPISSVPAYRKKFAVPHTA